MRCDEARSAFLLDRLAGVSPSEGVRHCVVVVLPKFPQLRVQIRHRREVAAPQKLPVANSKYDLDVV